MPRIGGCNLKIGQQVKLLEQDQVIDMGVTLSIGTGSANQWEISYRSQQLHPEMTVQFAFFQSDKGWRLLFDDPMTVGCRCSSQNAPLYDIRPV